MTPARATILPAPLPLPLALRRKAAAALRPYDGRDALALAFFVVTAAASGGLLWALAEMGGR